MYYKFYDIHISKDQNFNLFDNSTVFHISLFDVRFPDDDLQKTTTCQSMMDCMWNCIQAGLILHLGYIPKIVMEIEVLQIEHQIPI